VNGDAWNTTIVSVAPYAQADIGLLGDRLHIVPGLRIEPYVTGTNKRLPTVGDDPGVGATRETSALDPRLAVNYQMVPRLGFKAAAGYYHQSPQGADLSSVFGNPKLDIEHAFHLLGGATFKLTEHLSVEEVVFYSKSDNLVVRSNSSTPLLAEALSQEGQGRAYGTQLLLRQELASGFFGWVSYTLMRSERKDHPANDWRLFDYDQTHVATVVASYDLGAGFEVGARFRYATGLPRTPVTGSFYSARRDLYEPTFGQQNSQRIPAFVQADARLAKRFQGSWWKGELYVDVQNITDRQNPEEVVYNYNYGKRAYITGLPTLPVAGGRFEW
jgi:hypothetical protein